MLVSSMATSQVKFEAKASKTKLGVNERLRIDFEMNQDGDNFNPPDFAGFTVVGGPNQSVSNSWINGVRSYKKTYTYFLSPTKRGNFIISQGAISIQDATYKTTPIKIKVTAAVDIHDFWSQNINTKGQKVQNGTYNGAEYRYLILRKTVLYRKTS